MMSTLFCCSEAATKYIGISSFTVYLYAVYVIPKHGAFEIRMLLFTLHACY